MRFYAVGMMTITDPAPYRRYQAAFLPVLRQYGGRMLAADEHPEVIDGVWPHGKLVILEFDDEASFRSSMKVPNIARSATIGLLAQKALSWSRAA